MSTPREIYKTPQNQRKSGFHGSQYWTFETLPELLIFPPNQAHFQDVLQIQDLQDISKNTSLYTLVNYIGIFTKVSDEFGQVTECGLGPPLYIHGGRTV